MGRLVLAPVPVLARFRGSCSTIWVSWSLELCKGVLFVDLGLRTPEFEPVPILARLRGSCSTIWVSRSQEL